MKAYVLGETPGINSLSLVTKVPAALQPTQVLIDVKAVSLNYRDKLVINGIWKAPAGRVPLSDGVGVVTKTGSDVQQLKTGDRVAGLFFPKWASGRAAPELLQGSLGGSSQDGMLQQQIVLDETAVIKVPGYLRDVQAATLPCAALVAWNGLMEQGNIVKGHTVLIQGSGAVSLFSLQFAKLLGANVIALSGSDEKLERLRRLGADHLINYKQYPGWEKIVKNITGGKGADHVAEVVGAENINRSIEAVAMGGTISVIGLMNGFKGMINTADIMEKNIRLQGVVVGSKQLFENMNRALEKNKLMPVIDKVFPFGEAKTALRYFEEGKYFGKICISI